MDQQVLGRRIAEGRRLAHRTQEDLAAAVGLPRTALTKIEAGARRVEALELASLARELGLPLRWFVEEGQPLLQSRREGRPAAVVSPPVDLLLERLVAAAEQVEGWVDPPAKLGLPRPGTLDDAVRAAVDVRKELENPSAPVNDLARACDRVGLWAFSLEVQDDEFDGASVALRRWNLALVNGRADSGRRRWTLAHELGHALFNDEYVIHRGDQGPDDMERLIDVFAAHLLLPDSGLLECWTELNGPEGPRQTLLRIAADYRVSWSVATARAQQVGLIDAELEQELRQRVPRGGEFLEHGIFLVEDLQPPSVPPSYTKAVLAAYRRHHLSPERTVELLWGALDPAQLPERDELPLDEYVRDLEGLG